MRLVDIDKAREEYRNLIDLTMSDTTLLHTLYGVLDTAPTVEAIPKDHIAKAIDKVEEYICDHEKDTVKAQGMAQALDIFEQALGEIEDGNAD